MCPIHRAILPVKISLSGLLLLLSIGACQVDQKAAAKRYGFVVSELLSGQYPDDPNEGYKTPGYENGLIDSAAIISNSRGAFDWHFYGK